MKLWFPEEKVLRQVILPELEQGRKDWDRPHTETVVYWMKRLLKNLPKFDKKVMITAAYAHDWGYVGMFPDRESYENVQAAKKHHMRMGARKILNFLADKLREFYEAFQIERIAHLVRVHDSLDELKDGDEIALMEADTLGALDVSRVKPTFSEQDNVEVVRHVEERRRPLFKHDMAIKYYDKLVNSRKNYYK